eukprot:GHVT01088705.1.p1 GENE.GHVT01088705.1~~GHVT01088705.1.p1  ORF type:complete len:374 (-),score=24.16 GHVT01088705.1:2085-3206(-)
MDLLTFPPVGIVFVSFSFVAFPVDPFTMYSFSFLFRYICVLGVCDAAPASGDGALLNVAGGLKTLGGRQAEIVIAAGADAAVKCVPSDLDQGRVRTEIQRAVGGSTSGDVVGGKSIVERLNSGGGENQTVITSELPVVEFNYTIMCSVKKASVALTRKEMQRRIQKIHRSWGGKIQDLKNDEYEKQSFYDHLADLYKQGLHHNHPNIAHLLPTPKRTSSTSVLEPNDTAPCTCTESSKPDRKQHSETCNSDSGMTHKKVEGNSSDSTDGPISPRQQRNIADTALKCKRAHPGKAQSQEFSPTSMQEKPICETCGGSKTGPGMKKMLGTGLYTPRQLYERRRDSAVKRYFHAQAINKRRQALEEERLKKLQGKT